MLPVVIRDRIHQAVSDVEISPDALALATLSRVDYTDSFLLEAPHADAATGEEWARAVLEDAPRETRTMLRRGWFALGVRLGSTADERLVLGWPVHRSSSKFALLAAGSWVGMQAEVLFKPERDALRFATFLKLTNPLARAAWAAFSPQHRRVVRHLLREAGARRGDGRMPPA